MHHRLKGRQGERRTYVRDRRHVSQCSVRAAPRLDSEGRTLCHWSWVEFDQGELVHVSHRWFLPDGSVAYAETLLDSVPAASNR